MPRNPIDFSKIVMYKLVCNDLNIHNVYVGSTINMINRKSTHKTSCNNVSSKKYNQKNYKIIRLNGGFENWSMVMIEKYPCNNRLEASAREHYWMETLNGGMNTYIPGNLNSVGKTEYCKRNHVENRDKILKRQKLYHINNSKIISERKRKNYLNNKIIKYEYQWDDGTPCSEQEYYDNCV